MRILSHGVKADIYKDTIIKGIKKFCEKHKYSGLHINFFDKREIQLFKENRFIIRVGEQFHFNNHNYTSFNHFLSTLSYKKRKNIIKERDSLLKQNIKIEILDKNNIDQKVCSLMYDFYIKF